MEQKLSKDGKVLIIDRIIGNAIEIFLNTFLAAYFYKITEDNMIYISIYHIIEWTVATIGAVLLGNYIKRKNKLKLYRVGTFVKALFIFLIIVLEEKIVNYVWLIGICCGVSVATTGFPLNMLESELVNENERSRYLGYKSSIGEITKIILPVFMGAYITFTSYRIAAILVLCLSIVKFITLLFIKNKNSVQDKVKLKQFIKVINEKKEYPIKKIYIIEFLKGITVNGVLSKVVSLLIIYEFKNELDLGIWTSIFSIAMIITMTLFGKYYTKNKKNIILNICMISVILSFMCILILLNKTTIIIYNFVYYIFIQLLDTIVSINLYDYSNKSPFDKEFNTEYFIFREIFLNCGRIIGYIILLAVGLRHDVQNLKVVFIFTTIALLGIIFISKKIEKTNLKNQV